MSGVTWRLDCLLGLDFLPDDFDGWIVSYVYLTFGLSWYLKIGLSVMGT